MFPYPSPSAETIFLSYKKSAKPRSVVAILASVSAIWVRLLSGEFNLACEGKNKLKKGFWQIVKCMQNDSLRLEANLLCVLCWVSDLIFRIVLLLSPAGITEATKLRSYLVVINHG